MTDFLSNTHGFEVGKSPPYFLSPATMNPAGRLLLRLMLIWKDFPIGCVATFFSGALVIYENSVKNNDFPMQNFDFIL